MGQAQASEIGQLQAQVFGLFIVFVRVVFFGIVSGSITSFIMNTLNRWTIGTVEYTGTGRISVCGLSTKPEELLVFCN